MTISPLPLRERARVRGKFPQATLEADPSPVATRHPLPQGERKGRLKSAFTLAEVLITLGIIGLVAALTLPSIIQKKNDKEAVVRLKKMYSTIDNAYRTAIVENGSPDTWSKTPAKTPEAFANILERYVNIAERKENSHYYLKFLSVKSPVSVSSHAQTRFRLLDGSEFSFVDLYSTSAENAACEANVLFNNRKECIWLLADINGIDKLPNRLGEDMFYFILAKNRVYPVGMSGYWGFHTCRPDKSGDGGTGYGCTAYVLLHENRDYLKCKTGSEAICSKLKY